MEFLKEYKASILLAFSFLMWFDSCSTHRFIKTKVTQFNEKTAEIDSLLKENKEQREKDMRRMEILLEIESIKTSYRSLYNENSIERKKTRPDDVMKEYTDKIEKLEKELKNL